MNDIEHPKIKLAKVWTWWRGQK